MNWRWDPPMIGRLWDGLSSDSLGVSSGCHKKENLKKLRLVLPAVNQTASGVKTVGWIRVDHRDPPVFFGRPLCSGIDLSRPLRAWPDPLFPLKREFYQWNEKQGGALKKMRAPTKTGTHSRPPPGHSSVGLPHFYYASSFPASPTGISPFLSLPGIPNEGNIRFSPKSSAKIRGSLKSAAEIAPFIDSFYLGRVRVAPSNYCPLCHEKNNSNK